MVLFTFFILGSMSNLIVIPMNSDSKIILMIIHLQKIIQDISIINFNILSIITK